MYPSNQIKVYLHFSEFVLAYRQAFGLTTNSSPPNKVVTNINNPVGKAPASNSSTNGLEGINDFNPIEMSNKWSDAYSFIQNNPTPMEFTYQFIQKEGSNSNSQINQNNNLRKKGSQLDQRLEKLQMERSKLNNNMMRRK